MLAVRLPNDIEDRLANLAQATGRTKTYYVREAILAHLGDLEDYYLAASTVERIRTGEENVYSSNDVRASLGLED